MPCVFLHAVRFATEVIAAKWPIGGFRGEGRWGAADRQLQLIDENTPSWPWRNGGAPSDAGAWGLVWATTMHNRRAAMRTRVAPRMSTDDASCWHAWSHVAICERIRMVNFVAGAVHAHAHATHGSWAC